MDRYARSIAAVFLSAWALTRAEPGPSDLLLRPEPHYGEIARRFAEHFPREHLTHLAMDDEVSRRAWTNYLVSLDYERVYFLASDIQRFRDQETALDDRLKEGDLSFAFDVFVTFRDRVRNRYEHLSAVLERGFGLNTNETYRWRRKNAPWPANPEEWDELWRKRIKSNYVQLVVARRIREESTRKGQDAASQPGPQPSPPIAVATNPPAASTNAPPATNAAPASVGRAEDDTRLSPEENIRQRYKQVMTVMQDCDAEWVLQKYLSAFARAYDPHSDYMSPSSVEDFDIEMKLSLVGIGALLSAEDGTAKIVRLIPGGPADQDRRDIRLRPGDKIVGVAQDSEPSVNILHWPLYKTVRLIRGKKGTRVVLTVVPATDPTESTTKTVDLVRDEVKLEEQAAKWRTEAIKTDDGSERKLGVITLPTFYANMRAMSRFSPGYRSASDDVLQLLDKARTDGVDGVLLDLRGNGGGSLLEAIRMTGLFIRTGPTVQVREIDGIRVLPDRDPRVAYAGPLVVLVNRLSASASEILAGALQDYGRAVIVGDAKTHGKGTVQAVVELGRDKKLGSLKITSSMFYRISGSSTQLRGVAPDVILPSPFDDMEWGEDQLANPMEWSRVDPAAYTPVADMNPFLTALRERSTARRGSDAMFQAYARRLRRFREINKSDELTLDLATRLRLAREEQELADLQTELEDEQDPNAKKAKPDPVLREGLGVLADLIALSEQAAAAAAPPPSPSGGPLTRVFQDWIKAAP